MQYNRRFYKKWQQDYLCVTNSNFVVGNIFSLLLFKPFFMEKRYTTDEASGNNVTETNKTKTGLTPRELIHYHINNPDEPISDADIENLVLDTNLTPADDTIQANTGARAADNRMLNEEEIKQSRDRSITTSYDILDE